MESEVKTTQVATSEAPDSRHLLRRLIGLALLIALVALAVTSLPGLGTLRARFAQADGFLLALEIGRAHV